MTYTLCRGVSTASQRAWSPKPGPGTVTVPGASVAQPARSPALQSCKSNADTVVSKLAVYRVSLAGSIWRPFGPPPGSPSVSVAIVPHPDCRVALQVLASNALVAASVPT